MGRVAEEAFAKAQAEQAAATAAPYASAADNGNTYSYNGQTYDASYEPRKDTSLSYADRMRLQMAKDEAIRDSQMTMSLDDAMALLGDGYLKDSGADLSGDQYKQAYDRLTDAFENPNALGDMTDEQITQLQRLGSSSLSGNLYDIARARDDIADASFFDTDLQGLLEGASKEAVGRYGDGMFSEDYAADPANPDVPRVGAGDLSDAIRGEEEIIDQPSFGGGGGGFTPPPVPTPPPGYGGNFGSPSTSFGQGPRSSMGAPGEYERTNPTGDMSNQQLYDTQFQNLLNQSNNFQEQQQIAAGIRNEANAKDPAEFDRAGAFDWFTNSQGGQGLSDIVMGTASPSQATGAAANDYKLNQRYDWGDDTTNQQIINDLRPTFSAADQTFLNKHPDYIGDSNSWASGGQQAVQDWVANNPYKNDKGWTDALNKIQQAVYTNYGVDALTPGGVNVPAGYASPTNR